MPAPERLAVITIDGPAASGKSTTAHAVAAALGFRRADSGAIYRGVTAARIRDGGAPASWTEASVLAAARRVTLTPAGTAFDIRVDGAPAADELRGAAVTASVSLVARMPGVRAWVNARMRECAASGPIVVDGRDMGTAVFPDAALKVWLVADAGERARRRSVEMLGRLPTDDELESEVVALTGRDSRDAMQSQPASDAVHLDTTRLTPDEQVSRIVALARERLGAGGLL
jgi:cytidylate kinase